MKYKFPILIFILLFCQTSGALGQISTFLRFTSTFEMKVENLYELTIMNSLSETQCEMRVQVKLNGKNVYDSKTKRFQIIKGSQNKSLIDFEIVSEKFPAGEISNHLSNYREFPYGNYEICYEFFNPNTFESLGENCEWRLVEPATPILLTFPSDESVITTLNPILNWMPPSPISKFGFKYEVKVVEILGSQSKQEAIRRNSPMLRQDGIQELSFFYPLNAMNLENHKSYAWQVVAPSNRKLDSEVFRFRVELDSNLFEEKIVFNENFIVLNGSEQNAGLNIKNQLRIVLPVSNRIPTISYEIFDLNGKQVLENNSDFINSVGDNKFILSLTQIKQLKSKTYYQIRIHYPGQKQENTLAFRFFSM